MTDTTGEPAGAPGGIPASTPAATPAWIPAGWYPDPASATETGRTRWWDGATWTADVREPQPPTAPVFASAPAYTPTPAYESSAEPAYRPFGGGYASNPTGPEQYVTRGLAWTRQIGWIVTQPLWTSVPIAIAVALTASVDPQTMLANTGTIRTGGTGLGIIILLVLLALARRDRARLMQGGFQSVPSLWWMLLTPLAYLISRSIHFNRWDEGGWSPTVWWIIVTVISPVIAVLAYFGTVGLFTF